MTTNEIVYLREEFNSHMIALVHQYGRRFIALGNQYGRRDVSLRSRRLEVTGTGKNWAWESSRAVFFLAPITFKRQATVTSCESALLSQGVLSHARSDTHAPQAPDYSVCNFR